VDATDDDDDLLPMQSARRFVSSGQLAEGGGSLLAGWGSPGVGTGACFRALPNVPMCRRDKDFSARPNAKNEILALSERHESGSPSGARRVRYLCARPARGSGVGSPGRRIGSRKGAGNSAPRETFRTGRRKARAESRFGWRTKRQPVRGTLSPFEPAPRAAVPVDAPPPVNVQISIPPRDPADETAVFSIRLHPAHLRPVIGVISDGAEGSTTLSLGGSSRVHNRSHRFTCDRAWAVGSKTPIRSSSGPDR
jgi:hypothetical protein